MDDLSRRATAAAIAVAKTFGLQCGDLEVLADGSNVLAHLKPAPVVARVATTTGLVRRPIQKWLALDLDIAGFLAGQNFPVVPPSRELAPGPHLHDGLTLTFWEFVEHDRNYVATAEETAALLRDLHAALRGYQGELEWLNPFFEIQRWLDEIEPWSVMSSEDMAMLRLGFTDIAARLAVLDLPEQPLHGDAHRKNLLKTSRGLVWTDFEDICYGPIEWDLACFVRTSGENKDTALARYGGNFDIESLPLFFEARDLQGAAWLSILSSRFSDRRERAAQQMAICRERYR